jgi:transcriptional regulator
LPVFCYASQQYMTVKSMAARILDRELKKGSAELLILALVEDRPRHGYDIGKLIVLRSKGTLRFNVASLYPLLYRLEKRGWIEGRWTERSGQRRRRMYRLTSEGRKVLAAQRSGWKAFAQAINWIARTDDEELAERSDGAIEAASAAPRARGGDHRGTGTTSRRRGARPDSQRRGAG